MSQMIAKQWADAQVDVAKLERELSQTKSNLQAKEQTLEVLKSKLLGTVGANIHQKCWAVSESAVVIADHRNETVMLIPIER